MALFRLLVAAALSAFVMPTANSLTPDQSVVVRPQFPEAVLSGLHQHIAMAARGYGIDEPSIQFVASKAAGVTMASSTPGKKGADILLGEPVQRQAYRDNPDLLKAVASHEFGHAVMIARNDSFPTWAILVMYAAGLFPFLVVFSTVRSIAFAALAMTTGLGIVMLNPTWGIAHSAYIFFQTMISLAAVMAWILGFGKYMPCAKALGIAGIVALPLFHGSSYLIGQMNVQRELRADAFGACLTSPTTMRDALLALSDARPSPVKEAFDTFHPSMQDRIAILEAQVTPSLGAKTCQSLKDGNSPVILNGRVIQ